MNEVRKTALHYQDKKLELQYIYVSAYQRACMIPRHHRAGEFFAATVVKLRGSASFRTLFPPSGVPKFGTSLPN